MTPHNRFISKVEILDSGCWRWTSDIDVGGYGRFHLAGRTVKAHRAAWQLFKSLPVAAGKQLDHLCRNRACVNPSHLEEVSPKENTLRSEAITALRAKQTHCVYGHEFTLENTLAVRLGRQCKACRKSYSAAYYQRRKNGAKR